jgi:CRP-like cAMP-binding protein
MEPPALNPGPPEGQWTNHLLAALPEDELARLRPALEEIQLDRGAVLARPGQKIDHAYFPLDGMISFVALMSEGLGAEVATVGNEGMVGLPIFLGADSAPFHVMSQLAGRALRIPAPRLEEAIRTGERLGPLLTTYSQAFFVHTAQNAACNGLHAVPQRAARWLLATHDRAGQSSFFLTQEFLAFMLGVTRQSVGLAVSELSDQHMITYHRGHMVVNDRARLEAASCECYAIVAAEFARLLGISRA